MESCFAAEATKTEERRIREGKKVERIMLKRGKVVVAGKGRTQRSKSSKTNQRGNQVEAQIKARS